MMAPVALGSDPWSVIVIGLIAFILVTALATALLRDILSVIIVFAAYSLGMAVLYTVLIAPDVAMTEAAIGAGITTVLLLLTVAKTTRLPETALLASVHWPALAVVLVFLIPFSLTVVEFPAIGSPDAPIWSNPAVTQYYIDFAYVDTGVENAVTAVLAGYRGFDTFGEAVVIFTAGIAALIVLHTGVFTRE